MVSSPVKTHPNMPSRQLISLASAMTRASQAYAPQLSDEWQYQRYHVWDMTRIVRTKQDFDLYHMVYLVLKEQYESKKSLTTDTESIGALLRAHGVSEEEAEYRAAELSRLFTHSPFLPLFTAPTQKRSVSPPQTKEVRTQLATLTSQIFESYYHRDESLIVVEEPKAASTSQYLADLGLVGVPPHNGDRAQSVLEQYATVTNRNVVRYNPTSPNPDAVPYTVTAEVGGTMPCSNELLTGLSSGSTLLLLTHVASLSDSEKKILFHLFANQEIAINGLPVHTHQPPLVLFENE